MTKGTKGLGRGLDALFDDIDDVKTITQKDGEKLEDVREIKISEIEPMLNQPRKVFDKSKLEELAASIRENGIIQPILVVKNDSGYTIVAGERRWRAAKLANLKKVPVIIKDYTDTRKKQVALIENIQREDLNVIEVAQALKELMEIESYSMADVSRVTGKSMPAVSNTIRLLKLPNIIQDQLLEGKLVEGQARALLAIEDEAEQIRLSKIIIEKKLTVREVEKLIYNSDKYNIKKKKIAKKTGAIFRTVEEKLTEYFGMKVKIDAAKTKPRLVIEYYDNEGLERVLEKLKIEL
ncbi:MAG: ParB/RepB/Spo0J family partition protein [Clostridia bacterium]|nr:ParB/RepB/Spo0J family partition protein [Clostridia bacterium]MDD4375301.1 ParB/RepB/Spo0J family partition protein [Clostridia bacterium]